MWEWRYIKDDIDILILSDNMTWYLERNINIRKLIMKGENIYIDLKGFTLFVKEIIVEGRNITIDGGEITNKFKTFNGEIMETLSEVKILCKDLNLMIAKRCVIPPFAVLSVTNTKFFRLNDVNMAIDGRAIRIQNGTDIAITNGNISATVEGIIYVE